MSALKIALIDAGMGNLRSVMNAFEAIGRPASLARSSEDLAEATHVVLPGVGAFGEGIAKLRAGGWPDALKREVLEGGKPFLGICLGMQLLATLGTEHGEHAGLGWVEGTVRRLKADQAGLRVPHIGWNTVKFERTDGLFAGLGAAQDFYFVHSYVLEPADASVIAGTTDHGGPFVSAVARGNVHAVQFHPEKSHRAGLAVLKNFASLAVHADA